jgi:hypothetical protein
MHCLDAGPCFYSGMQGAVNHGTIGIDLGLVKVERALWEAGSIPYRSRETCRRLKPMTADANLPGVLPRRSTETQKGRAEGDVDLHHRRFFKQARDIN